MRQATVKLTTEIRLTSFGAKEGLKYKGVAAVAVLEKSTEVVGYEERRAVTSTIGKSYLAMLSRCFAIRTAQRN